MNKTLVLFALLVMLAIATSVCAQSPGKTGCPKAEAADPASAVRDCLETVRKNIGGWCGTPEEEAYQRLSQMGKPAVPYLIEGLKRNDLADIDRFIAGTLSSICCYTFDGVSHDALVVQVDRWWRVHRNQTEQEWILDALGSGDSHRMGHAYSRPGRLTSRHDMAGLIALLKSEKKDVAKEALYILWNNFQSEQALIYVRKVCRNGTKDQKMMALQFCGDNKIKILSPTVADVLRKESDYQIIGAALDAATKMRASECMPMIEKMDRAQSSKYPMFDVIRALAALKTTAYGDRVLYYLKNGDRGERMAAAEVICDCVSPKNTIAPLLAALKDPEINVRCRACVGLGRSASDKSMRAGLGEIVPQLIELLRGKDESDLGSLAHEALKQICIAHFGDDTVPRVDGSLGGSRFSTQALPIWEEWWSRHATQ